MVHINLHHSKAATAALRKVLETCKVALIQEPWVFNGQVRGLSEAGGELIYSKSDQTPRACIYINRNLNYTPLTHLCCRNVAAVKIHLNEARGPRELILGSFYLPYEEQNPPSREMDKLVVACRAQGSQIIIGCDANAHHTLGQYQHQPQR